MNIPRQSPPVTRVIVAREPENMSTQDGSRPGVVGSQTACDSLPGLARQMCYAVEYGVSI
jgi:hypothetical protein